jgi:hypothetical protein
MVMLAGTGFNMEHRTRKNKKLLEERICLINERFRTNKRKQANGSKTSK